jgi:ketosteroid isomerase-like protein
MAMTLEDVFARRDLAAFLELLDSNVVWQGVPPDAVCRGRAEVSDFLEDFVATGSTGWPEIIAQVDDRFVVDPHPEPPPEFAPELCQVFTMSAGKVVRIDDFPNRASALETVGA